MNIILGVTGSIAAYKAADIVRALQRKGHEVRVACTPAATAFISPLTFEVLTQHEVMIEAIDTSTSQVKHIEWARWADLLLIAPASATTIAKCASGIADNFLTLLYLATEAQVVVAPAMNTKMLLHPQTQKNLHDLSSLGVGIIPSASGSLACMEEGAGKLPTTTQIIKFCEAVFAQRQDLKGRKILITAGATREHLDPVRFVTNHSSGKMGISLAYAAMARGAQVPLLLGHVQEEAPVGCEVHYVETTDNLLNEMRKRIAEYDAIIMAAAPADFKPRFYQAEKIKKTSTSFAVEWEKNPDILKTLHSEKLLHNKTVIGFAAESQNLVENAQKKCHEKHLDLIVANNIKGPDSAFASENNRGIIYTAEGKIEKRPKESKMSLAHAILDYIVNRKSL